MADALELATRAAEHRSPLVQRCVDDFLAGVRYPLDLLFTHPSAIVPSALPAVAMAEAGSEVHGGADWPSASARTTRAK